MQRRLARMQLLAVHQHKVRRHSWGSPAICERGGLLPLRLTCIQIVWPLVMCPAEVFLLRLLDDDACWQRGRLSITGCFTCAGCTHCCCRTQERAGARQGQGAGTQCRMMVGSRATFYSGHIAWHQWEYQDGNLVTLLFQMWEGPHAGLLDVASCIGFCRSNARQWFQQF